MQEDFDNLVEITEEQKLGPEDHAFPVQPIITINLTHEFYGRMQLAMRYNPTDIPQ